MLLAENTNCMASLLTEKYSGNDLINWHRERCGASEKVHSVIKSELAGGQFPSNILVQMLRGGGISANSI